MANTLDYAKKFVPIIDGIYKASGLTEGMDSATQVDFTGVNEVKVLKIETSGLGNYSRTTGYPKGDITANWETIKLAIERGKELAIDRMDNEETLGMVFGEVTGQFMREFVIPEIDAYRFAKYASTTGIQKATAVALTKDTILSAIDEAVRAMDAEEVPMEGRRLFINSDLKPILNTALTRQFGSDGAINTVLAGYNDMPITYVPKKRFYTGVTLNAGTTSWGYTKGEKVKTQSFVGDATNSLKIFTVTDKPDTLDSVSVSGTIVTTGFTYTKADGKITFSSAPADDAPIVATWTVEDTGINFMIVYPKAILQATKFALPKIFTPDENQEKDEWKFQFRLYHDAYAYENKAKGIYLHSNV